jgi:hypothetical protein
LLPVIFEFNIAGLSATTRNKTRGRGLAIAGLEIGSQGLVLTVLTILILVVLFANF